MSDSMLKFYVPDLHCGGCVKRFTSAMDKDKTQQNYEFQCDPLKRQVTFESESVKSIPELKKQMFEAGFPAYILVDSKKMQLKEQRDFLKRIFVSVIGMMQVMMFALTIYMEDSMPQVWLEVFHWFSLFVTTPVLLYAGKPYFISAAGALLRKQVNMEVPVAIALIVAYVYSFMGLVHGVHTLYFDSINMFLFFLTLGRFAEWKARYKTTEASEALWADIPQTVTVVTDEGDIEKELTQVRPKDIVLVKVGSQFPIDGEIISGQSLVDESMLTGESEPVLRQIGDQVFAGTVNQTQSVQVRTKAVQGATQLGHIQRLLFEAQDAKPKLARMADKVAGYFILRLLILAVVVGGFWWWYDPSQAIPIVVSLLIVTCPCALSLATPAAIAAALARLTQQGIVVAKGDALEKVAKITHFVFDKTGTLTEGTFEIDQVKVIGENTKDSALSIAAALEATTEHPIGKAFTHNRQSNDVATDIEVLPGVGIQGVYQEQSYLIGAPDIVLQRLAQDNISAEMRASIQAHLNSAEGITQLLLIAKPATPIAVFNLKSKIRDDVQVVLDELKPHGISLLSGDHETAVSTVAQSLGIQKWQSRATPASKQAYIQELQKTESVLMVGDGVNDGPVLAQADIGIAMGQGTALAKSSADVILIHDRLQDLNIFISTANGTRKIIRENMIWAVAYNLVAIPFAAAGLVPPWLAAIGMSTSSLLVVLNSLRLLKWNKTD